MVGWGVFKRKRRGFDKIIMFIIKISGNKYWVFGKCVDGLDRIVDVGCDLGFKDLKVIMIFVGYLFLGIRDIGGWVIDREGLF